ncbi:hypothetical protein AB1Y20_018266 [Prymnesium parvum]|uniref:Major facilitator superfamily (MFS) profile domain-containing protein n=1 Tax=Prymnesium parvum TaxID=97485 RepID=A0AB34JMW9_PRYPA
MMEGAGTPEASFLPSQSTRALPSQLAALLPAQSMGTGSLNAVLFACIAAIGPLIFGYTLGYTSPSDLAMEASSEDHILAASLQSCADKPCGLSSQEVSVYGSVVNVGCMIGALLGGQLCDLIGRKGTIMVSALPWLGSWVLQGLSGSFAPLLVGRVICGVAVGIASTSVPVFISEMSPTALRGALGAVNQLAVTMGIFLVYLLGDMLAHRQQTIFACNFSTSHDQCRDVVSDWQCVHGASPSADVCYANLSEWRALAFIGAGLSCALFLGVLLLVPETPAHLVSSGRLEEARRVLSRVRDSPMEVEREFEQLKASSLSSTSADEGGQLTGFVADAPDEAKKVGGLRGLMVKGVRQPFAIGCTLMITQQFSGINAVIFYSGDILATTGMEDPNVGGLLVMGIQVVMTFVSVILMDRAGRRPLLLISLGGMTIAATLLAVFYFNGKSPGQLALFSLIMYIVTFSLGLGAIPWLIMGELFPSHVRAAASSVAALFNWLLSFIVTLCFQTVADALTQGGAFLLFAGICLSGFTFVFFLVPETRGKSFDEIAALFE